MNSQDLENLLESFKSRKVLVVGDTIIDVNIYCKIRGISAETPTMVLSHQSQEVTEGGSACVRRNLAALGAQVKHMTSVYGAVRKTRTWVDGYKMLQVDQLPEESAKGLKAEYDTARRGVDTVVVADYRHGFISKELAGHIVSNTPEPLFVASQVSQEASNHYWYLSENTIFVVNEKERKDLKPWPSLKMAKNIVTTRGNKGASSDKQSVDAIPITPIDTCGAGDAFLAAYALSNSLEFSNIWAGLSTTVRGANPPTIEMFRKWVRDNEH